MAALRVCQYIHFFPAKAGLPLATLKSKKLLIKAHSSTLGNGGKKLACQSLWGNIARENMPNVSIKHDILKCLT